MSLASEYRRQFAWRDWGRAFEALPPLADALVLDLGCAVGDQATELQRGARVLGLDGNEELLEVARARGLERAEFQSANLAALPDLGVRAEGIWCSFAAGYFPSLPAVLSAWAQHLVPGGWIALTEVDDLFAHEPLPSRARELLEGYADEALSAGRFDFRMGRKLEAHLARAGFVVTEARTLADRELAFDGPAAPDVLEAWRARVERMSLLRAHCGAEFPALREAFLGCLARPEHRSLARVRFCLCAPLTAGERWTRATHPRRLAA